MIMISRSSLLNAQDMDLAVNNAYAGPDHITNNIQHGTPPRLSPTHTAVRTLMPHPN